MHTTVPDTHTPSNTPCEKACSKCGQVKPLSEFYTHPHCALRRRRECKECWKAYMRQRFAADPELAEAQRERCRAYRRRKKQTEVQP